MARVFENMEAVTSATNQLAQQFFQSGEIDKTEELFRKILLYDEALLGTDHTDTGRALFNLAMVLREKKQLNEAQELLYRALPIFTIHYGPQDELTLSIRKSLKELIGSEPRLNKLPSYIYSVKLPNQKQN